MRIKPFLVDFVTVFAATAIVSVLVTVLWNIGVRRALTVDWDTSFRFAIVFGILLSWILARRRAAH